VTTASPVLLDASSSNSIIAQSDIGLAMFFRFSASVVMILAFKSMSDHFTRNAASGSGDCEGAQFCAHGFALPSTFA
jgi:hypothetical protein